MDAHTLRVLEFPAVLEQLASEAASVLGRQRAVALAPTTDPDLVAERLAQTRECRALLGEGPPPRLERAADIRPALARAAIAGSRLAPQDLLTIADTLEAAAGLRRSVQASRLDLPRLHRLVVGLHFLPDLTAEIRRCLAPDGAVLDAASAALARLRTESRRAREAARETLQGLLVSPALQPIIAEAVITLRNDRYVIPVTPGYRAHLSGVVQDQSGSGRTLFLEPLGVVELNNAIRRLEREAEAEADRILEELTERVRAGGAPIRETVETLADLDLMLAKGRLAERWRAAEPRLAPDGVLRLRAARHPLLLEARRGRPVEEGVVPIDVDVGPEARVLVVTGPNTGGKTVALKTVGLAALMVQAGLHIPASPDSQLPAYGAVYADIGDEQSIAQDLSTFSAHVVRLRTILGRVGPESLVLLDEIGAGTDPGEGAALGSAILEDLACRGCHVLATTHLDAVKGFVAADRRMMNAAVEFDLDRLRPLYRLHIGLPGRSFAIDIACRLGIPPTIIQRSRDLLGDSGAEVAVLLGRLQAMEERHHADAAEAAREREAAAASHAAAERLAAELRGQVAVIRAKAGRLVSEIAAEARRQAESAVADLRRGGDIRGARQVIQALPLQAETHLEGLAPEGALGHAGDAAPTGVVPGQRVRIRHLDQVGTVLAEGNAQGLVEVQLPVGKTRVRLESLTVVGEGPRPAPGGVTWTAGAGDALTAEINVIGCTVDEAAGRVQRYLEDAVLGGLSQVRIIHGKGTGRLRKGLAELLKSHPLVAGFHLAPIQEGGAGATIVALGSRETGEAAGGASPSPSVRTG